MRNLEHKVRCTEVDLADVTSRALRLGAVANGTLWQRDTYFHAPLGRLKLREIGHMDQQTLSAGLVDEAVLIGYVRADSHQSRFSSYQLVPVKSPESLREALGQVLGIRGVVEKTRVLLLYKHTRIHLDTVVGLGTFVELETVEPEMNSNDTLLHDEHARVSSALGLERFAAVPASYIDLLETATGAGSKGKHHGG